MKYSTNSYFGHIRDEILSKVDQKPREIHIKFDGSWEIIPQIKILPEEIGLLTSLEELYIEQIGLQYLPESIGNLTNLRILNISDNNIKKLPESIKYLKRLSTLVLSNNKIKIIPKQIFTLKNLKELILNDNEIKQVPSEINRLKFLTELDLSFNNIHEISTKIKHLKYLENLDLMFNRIKIVPKEIKYLKKLNRLNLGSNQISVLPEEIGKLTKLYELNLEANKILKIPIKIKYLKNLRTLNISDNKIQNLPIEITELKQIGTFSVDNNPLVLPPIEIIYGGFNAIKNYFESISEHETFSLHEAKLLIVGSGGVGKSTLMTKLISSGCFIDFKKINTTEGIDVIKWIIKTDSVDDFRINIWDFGGQEIYHATHQFFLTKRSLYLFVWDARTDDNLLSFDYWLNIISLLSDSSPVIALMNKMDERIKMIDEDTLKQKFRNLKAFHKISAINGIGIDVLQELIVQEIENLPHIGDTLPVVWLEIRSILETLNKNFITYKQYLNICKNCRINEKKAKYLSQYYHILGVFLHFQDNNLLNDIMILKPKWATHAVYKIIDAIEVQENYGKFNYNQLNQIWKNYPTTKYRHLLELMKKFEICFELPKKKVESSEVNEYIIPELLRSNKPNFNWDYNDNLKYEYRYDFMPAGIMTRLIVRTHDLLKNDLFWKFGTVLSFENTDALIICESINRKIGIWVKGNRKRELLSIIRREIYTINKSLNNPPVSEMIPCICKECKLDKKPYFHSFDDIMLARQKRKKYVECKNSFENVLVNELLGEIQVTDDFSNITTIENIYTTGQVYISDKINSISNK